MVNKWSGKLIDIQELDGDDESRDPDVQLESALYDYFYNHLCGMSRLKGGGKLISIWDDVEEEVLSEGEIAVVEFNQKQFLASVTPNAEGNNLLRKYDRVKLALIDNKNVLIESRKDYIDPITGKEYTEGYPFKYVVFQNNKDSESCLKRLKYFVKQMVMQVKQMRKELFMNEKRLLFILPEQPDDDDVEYFMQGWRKGTMVVITFQRSKKPSKEGRSEGKEGISPHNINYQVYEPKIDQGEWLIRNFNFWLSLAEKLIGIRSDPLKEKDERATKDEVLSSTASFKSFEKKGWKIRAKGIREYMDVFGEKASETNYELEYGDIKDKV